MGDYQNFEYSISMHENNKLSECKWFKKTLDPILRISEKKMEINTIIHIFSNFSNAA